MYRDLSSPHCPPWISFFIYLFHTCLFALTTCSLQTATPFTLCLKRWSWTRSTERPRRRPGIERPRPEPTEGQLKVSEDTLSGELVLGDLTLPEEISLQPALESLTWTMSRIKTCGKIIQSLRNTRGQHYTRINISKSQKNRLMGCASGGNLMYLRL